ncbi:hypothetical protein BY458DRAFT_150945 [Sporodiniella umbellata]|nr:hypothetical protein BY458DRAFT_150945 [Sporodiniella umbellata]
MSKPYYIKAVREKSFLFLCYQPDQSINEVKSNLCKALDNKKTHEEVRLLIQNDRQGEYTVLEDVSDIENGSTVYFVYLDTTEGQWETVNVVQPQLNDDVEEPIVVKKEKGKKKA